MDGATPSLLRESLIMALAYGALAVVLLAPLFNDPSGSTLDTNREWHAAWYKPSTARAMERDINLFVWVYAWNWHALTTNPLEWFQANIFYPTPDTLALSEHAIGKLPITGPLQALSGNPIFAYQIDLLLCFALSAAAMFSLLRHFGVSLPAAFLGGFVYAFCPARLESLYHSYLLTGQYLPLVILFMDRTLLGGRRWDPIWLSICISLMLLSSYYLAYIGLIVLLAYAAVTAASERRRLEPTPVARVAAAGIAAALPFLWVSLPYLRVRTAGSIFDYGEGARALFVYSNHLWQNYLFSPLLLRGGTASLDQGSVAYLGIAVLLLCALALPTWKDAAKNRLRSGAIAITVAAWAMALGPQLTPDDSGTLLPYRLAMEWIPGFGSMRVPARFSLAMMAGVALLAGLGAERLRERMRMRGVSARTSAAVLVALGVVTGLEYGFAQERFETRSLAVGRAGPPIYRRLAELAPAPLLELPLSGAEGLASSEYMVHSTVHWNPLLNGATGYPSRTWALVRRFARRLPDPDALDALGRLTGLRYVIVHLDALDPAERERWSLPAGLEFVAAFEGDRLFEVAAPPTADLLPEVRACGSDAGSCDGLREALRAPHARGGAS